MMNRELRRAQAKMDKRAERERDERRDARKRKLEQARARRAERRAEAKARASQAAAGTAKPAAAAGGKRGRRAGRFAGALMMATVFFIVLQSSVPPQPGDNAVLRSVTGAGFYLLFGYFSTLWLMRRDTPRPLLMTWATGGMLLIGVETAKFFQELIPFDPWMVLLAIPGVVAGSYLGRLVSENTPA
jgi:hypothetical protein